VPFQASSFLALFKDDLIILYLGRVLGFEALGYIGWAKKWADAPIRIIMDNISRVLFPLVARFQDDKEKLRSISERILSYQTSLIAPVIVGMMATIPLFIQVIPRYNKWEPALSIFYILSLSTLILSVSAPFMNLFNALGKVKITFSFMVLLTTVNWIATPILTQVYGVYGFAFAHLMVSISLGFILLKAKRLIGIRVADCVFQPIISASCMGLVLLFLQKYLSTSYLSIAILVGVGAVVYYILMRYVFKSDVVAHLLSLYEKKT
jgi:O-antigen/teichoic acid export membrane protein